MREARSSGKHKKCDVSLTDNHVCKEEMFTDITKFDRQVKSLEFLLKNTGK